MKKLAIALAFIMTLSACGSSSIAASSSIGATSTAESAQYLISDEVINISFVKIFEEDFLPGTCYVQLDVANNTDQEITVYPTNAYANGTQITMGSGVPMTIGAGKTSQNPFFFAYSNAGIESIEDIKTIEFVLMITDSNTNIIEETEPIEISVN